MCSCMYRNFVVVLFYEKGFIIFFLSQKKMSLDLLSVDPIIWQSCMRHYLVRERPKNADVVNSIV